MKYSVMMTAKRDEGLVSLLGGSFQEQRLFPMLFLCEEAGSGAAVVRICLDCDRRTIIDLVARWESSLAVQSIVTTPTLCD
jgi:hypothetical protein